MYKTKHVSIGSAAYVVTPTEAYKEGIRDGATDARDGLFERNPIHPCGDNRIQGLYRKGYGDGMGDYILEHPDDRRYWRCGNV